MRAWVQIPLLTIILYFEILK
ncbi:hypothetical protein LINPERHAP1_LOCUS16495 [Linum perenne]